MLKEVKDQERVGENLVLLKRQIFAVQVQRHEQVIVKEKGAGQ